jgi:hypothetical protein
MSQQALMVYKSIQDQFDFLKKQQWATTNYVVLIYAAMIWIGQHVQPLPWLACASTGFAIAAGIITTGLLAWFQYDLGELRKRAARVENRYFPANEREDLGLRSSIHPYGRGWQVAAALILVCLVGAVLVVIVLNLPPRSC